MQDKSVDGDGEIVIPNFKPRHQEMSMTARLPTTMGGCRRPRQGCQLAWLSELP